MLGAAWARAPHVWSGTWATPLPGAMEKRFVVQNESEVGFSFELSGQSLPNETIPIEYQLMVRDCAKGKAIFLNDRRTKAIFTHPERAECNITFELKRKKRKTGIVIQTETDNDKSYDCSAAFYCDSFGNGNFNNLADLYLEP